MNTANAMVQRTGASPLAPEQLKRQWRLAPVADLDVRRSGGGSALHLAVKAFKLRLMSVQEIKEQLAALPRNEQDEVIAYLFHLRRAHDGEYASQTARRLNDKDPSHWLPPDAFERELDKKETP